MEEKNRMGGVYYDTDDELARAKNVDLITFPPGIKGTNCGNCRFIKKGYCTNNKVKLYVNDKMCCILWSAEHEYRQFKGRKNILGS